MFEIIKIVVAVLSFVFGWRIWIKVVDRVDELARKKLSDKLYDRLLCVIFFIMFGAIVFSIIR